MSWLSRHRLHLALYAFGVLVYALLAWNRLGKPSEAPHFVDQADAWLHGRLDLTPPLPVDDLAVVETVRLVDGRVVRGRTMTSRAHVGTFQTTSGERLPTKEIAAKVATTSYVSFPAFPSVLMLPQVALFGRGASDVTMTVLLAGLVLPLLLSILRRLADEELAPQRTVDQLWLVALFGFGTVFFFSAVQGAVWYTAHVVGVVLALGYIRASIGARHPLIAGLCLGCAAMTRTPMAFMFPLFFLEAVRVSGGFAAVRGGAWRALVRKLVPFAAPVIVIAIAGMVLNQLRFDSPLEFGHHYLFRVRQQEQMENGGLFSLDYLSRNLSVAFTLLPEFPPRGEWVRISGHGLAMWVTTPVLLYLLWPRARPPLHRNLWITVAVVAIPTFFYMNTGWFQFGYRFSLDYLPFLVVLLALGGRTTSRLARTLIVIGIIVNLFGAITFGRKPAFYGGNYDIVIRN